MNKKEGFNINFFISLRPFARIKIYVKKFSIPRFLELLSLIFTILSFFISITSIIHISHQEKAIELIKNLISIYNKASIDFFITAAYAAPISEIIDQIQTPKELLKLLMLSFVFLITAIYGLFCWFAVFTSKNSRTVTFAQDSIRMLLGFYVGAATGFLGS
ncbi:hypothetical protein [Roseibium litorale]|uniref:Uncharacterized protein n=1 Tax=Roseibium litorale TaxID=2803841 RepID=A0ABR9CIQ0_9HYPH|nr:hypothetical protein [Roseibium litorale]MBD8890186.1 hypothetical protein [Roseibium litorale]